jgi:hypothetical protein
MSAIPSDVALSLCAKIRERNRGRWYSFYGVWCYFCYRFTKGDPKKLCFSGTPDNRGCSQVNKQFDREQASTG